MTIYNGKKLTAQSTVNKSFSSLLIPSVLRTMISSFSQKSSIFIKIQSSGQHKVFTHSCCPREQAAHKNTKLCSTFHLLEAHSRNFTFLEKRVQTLFFDSAAKATASPEPEAEIPAHFPFWTFSSGNSRDSLVLLSVSSSESLRASSI